MEIHYGIILILAQTGGSKAKNVDENIVCNVFKEKPIKTISGTTGE